MDQKGDGVAILILNESCYFTFVISSAFIEENQLSVLNVGSITRIDPNPRRNDSVIDAAIIILL